MTDAGWHPDPHGRHVHRYHDGLKWTDDVADNGIQSKDPIVSATPPPSSGKQKRSKRPWLLAAGLLILLIAAGGGLAAKHSIDQTNARHKHEQQERALRQKEIAAAEAHAARIAQAKHDAKQEQSDCRSQMKGLVKALQQLNSRLDIGLNYTEYLDRVADAKVAYDAVDFQGADIRLRCIVHVGANLEKAFNSYAQAATIWQDCFTSTSCANDSITPELQAKWSQAGDVLDIAIRNQQRLGDPNAF